jgi:tetratricopeptide (TPR) repeat protein
MALPRFIVAIAACTILAGSPVFANEIQEINQQFRKGDLPGALARADRYLATNPKDAQARFLKGLILADQGKTSDAIQIFTGLTEDYPELPEPYNNLAVLHASQGKYEDAKNALEMAIRTHPSYATAHENLGDIYAKMASLAYDKALQLDTSNSTAQTKLALIKDMMGGEPRQPTAAKPTAAKPAVAAPVVTARNISPAPATPAATPVAPAASEPLETVIANWARAWSEKDVNAYLAFYAPEYAPSGITRSDWEAQRRSRISAPKSIEVQISELKVGQVGEMATATFRQAYRSDRHKSTTTKTLTFALQDGQWRIVGESSR